MFEIVQVDEVYGDAIQLGFQAPGVTVRELDAGNGCQDLQAQGWNAHPDDLPRLLEPGGIGLGETKGPQEPESEDQYYSERKKLVYYENDEPLIKEISAEFEREFGPALNELQDIKGRGSLLLYP